MILELHTTCELHNREQALLNSLNFHLFLVYIKREKNSIYKGCYDDEMSEYVETT